MTAPTPAAPETPPPPRRWPRLRAMLKKLILLLALGGLLALAAKKLRTA